jgi:uncharacterized protein YndB with AHSA1/START domain
MNDTQKELKMTRVFDAPAELVYKAWTDPKLVSQWWGPQGVFTPVCEVDARPGGKIKIVMEAGEELGDFKGTQWPMEGEFVELDEPRKIVFTSNAIDKGKVILEHRTTVTFEEENDPSSHEASKGQRKTKMTVHVVVTKVLPGSEFAIAGMEQGWNSQFDKLVKFIPTLQE